jgi:hypothetical protein
MCARVKAPALSEVKEREEAGVSWQVSIAQTRLRLESVWNLLHLSRAGERAQREGEEEERDVVGFNSFVFHLLRHY